MFLKKVLITTALLSYASFSFAGDATHKKTVGSSLHKKFNVDLNEVPKGVMSVILSTRPDFKAQEAQKELKHGNTYFDIEGLDASGNEIEFDMLLQDDGSWVIAEIQRDLALDQTPEPVHALYQSKLGSVSPSRIIESDQGGGVIVYEFYTVENKLEKKYEIKLQVEFLENEWKH